MNSIKLMLVDDHDIIRFGIKQLLRDNLEFEVIGEASTGEEALFFLNKKQPDVIISDISMPGLGGLHFIKEVRELYPTIQVLVLSMHIEAAFVRDAISCGAKGYLSKDVPHQQLVEAINTISKGQTYFSEEISKVLMNDLVRKSAKIPVAENDINPNLTPREHEILRLIIDGHKSAEIANVLHISSRTVQNHRANIMQKLKVKNTAELVRFVMKYRILGDLEA